MDGMGVSSDAVSGSVARSQPSVSGRKGLARWTPSLGSLAAAVLFMLSLGGAGYLYLPDYALTARTVYTLGLIAPLSGPKAAQGQEMLRGVKTYLNHVNQWGRAQGIRVDLSVRDSQGDPELGLELARSLAADPEILAILGPYQDTVLKRVGAIGMLEEIPIVTGGDGDGGLLVENHWLFRTGLTAELQGRVLAHYLVRVSEETELILLQEASDFGRAFGSALRSELSLLHRSGVGTLSITNSVLLPPGPAERQEVLETLSSTLARSYNEEMILLALGEQDAEAVIRLLQDKPKRRLGKIIPYRFAGPASLADPALPKAFRSLRRERETPGAYTNDMVVVAPFLLDTLSQAGAAFRRDYQALYGQDPSALAAAYSDAAFLLIRAMEDSPDLAALVQSDMVAARALLRDQIAAITHTDKALRGTTGSFFLDLDGNAMKAVPLGIYSGGTLVSPQVQLMPTGGRAQVDPEKVIQIHGHFFSEAQVIHTGVALNEIRNIDLENRSVELDFRIWFRFEGDLDLSHLRFENAAEEVSLGPPLEEVRDGTTTYRLHRVIGRFKTDFLPADLHYGQTQIGLQLRDLSLTRSDVMLVPDHTVMQIGQGNWTPDAVARSLLTPDGPDWSVQAIDLYQDTLPLDRLGNPLHDRSGADGFSRFNLVITLEPGGFALGNLMSVGQAKILLVVCLFLLAALVFTEDRYRSRQDMARLLWVPQALLSLFALVCAQKVVIDWMAVRQLPVQQIAWTTTVFQVVWWVVPAKLSTIALERFVWSKLEQRTHRDVPNVVRKFFAAIVYILAAMGILAFVFDQKITSLLATSGVLAMIIGLAIQMNLANIFSGIAINVEKPFRIGDWVKIGDYEPGRVVGMTWRTTRLETIDLNVICVPNSVASDSMLENFSYPAEAYRSQLEVHVDPGARPGWVEKILLDSVLVAEGILPTHPLEVRFDGVKQWSGEYHIRYFCLDYPTSIPLDSQIWRTVVRNLHYAGFESRIHEEFTLFHLKADAREGHASIPALVDELEVFAPFGPDERAQLGALMSRRAFDAGEVLVREGDKGDSLFVVVSGVVEISIAVEDHNPLAVARLGAGEFFGEMALLTGEPRSATVSALSDGVVFELTKSDLAPIIQAFPHVSEDLSEMLTRRSLANMDQRRAVEGPVLDEEHLPSRFIASISRFFNLSGLEDHPDHLIDRRRIPDRRARINSGAV